VTGSVWHWTQRSRSCTGWANPTGRLLAALSRIAMSIDKGTGWARSVGVWQVAQLDCWGRWW
jgi:hypothetical protein